MLRRLMMASHSSPPVTGFAAKIMSLNPWGYWKLNEPSGPSALDSSGNGRTATADSGVVFGAAGLFAGTSGAVTMGASATTARIAIPDLTAQAAGSRRLSIVCVTKPSGARLQQMVSADAAVTRAWQMRFSASGAVEIITFSPVSGATLSLPSSIYDGNPHIVCAVFDDSIPAADGRIKVYFDGALLGADTTGSQAYAAAGMICRPAMGVRASTTTSEPFGGIMDDCAIFQSALTAADISAIWDARNTP